MKNFKTLLKNACEEYFNSLDQTPTLDDIAELCKISISDIIWDACRSTKKAPILTQQDVAFDYIRTYSKSLLGKTIGHNLHALAHLFNLAKKYNISFSYNTNHTTYSKIQHKYGDCAIFEGFSVTQNKK